MTKTAWLLAIIVLGLAVELAVALWFGAPALSIAGMQPFAGVMPRVAAIALIGLLAIVVIAVLVARRGRLTDRRQLEAERATAAEIAVLRHAIRDILRRRGNRWRWLRPAAYSVPWYVVLTSQVGSAGPLLKAMGFRPAAVGRQELNDAGTAPLAALWSGPRALVLAVDAPGDTVLADGDTETGMRWRALLKLIRRMRPQQPLNGLILEVSASAFLDSTAGRRATLAEDWRDRIALAAHIAGPSIPAYLAVTGIDDLRGYHASCADLDEMTLLDLTGATLADTTEARAQEQAKALHEALRNMLRRLARHAARRAGAAPQSEQAGCILEFPAEVAILADRITQFAVTMLRPDPGRSTLSLRGVQFVQLPTTQPNLPDDRLLRGAARVLALDVEQFSPCHSTRLRADGTGLAGRFLHRDVLPEAGLANRHHPLRAAWRATLPALAALALLASSVTFGLVLQDRLLEADRTLDHVEQSLAASDSAVRALDTDAPLPDLGRTLPVLDRLAAEVPEVATLGAGLPLSDARETLANAHRDAYRRAQLHLLLPHLLVGIQAQLPTESPQGLTPQAELALFDRLMTYLTLGGQSPGGTEAALTWLLAHSDEVAPGLDDDATARLATHLHALLAGPLPRIPLDEARIAAARRALSINTLVLRGLATLQAKARAADDLPAWRPIDAAGPIAGRLLIRRSGRPLSDGIPAFYTRAGFLTIVAPALQEVAAQVATEAWVIPLTAGPDNTDLAKVLEQEIADDYFTAYVDSWNELLDDVTVAQGMTLQQAAQQLTQLAGPASPLERLYQAASRETDLTPPPAATTSPPASRAEGSLAKAIATGEPVTTRFAWLRELVATGDNGPSRLRQTIDSFGALGRQMAQTAYLPTDAAPTLSAGSAAGQVADSAASLPPPLARIANEVARAATSMTSAATDDRVTTAWRDVEPFCRLVTGNRYPFYGQASQATSLDDFAALFGPQGRLEKFFATYIRPFVDTTAPAWRVHPVHGMAIDIDRPALEQFQRAARIRDAFFADNPAAPSVRFSLEPLRLDATAETLTYAIGGQTLVYRHDPVRLWPMQWPPPDGQLTAQIQVTPWVANEPGSLAFRGPFAFLRLIEAGTPKPDGKAPDRFILRYALGSRAASLRLTAASIINPFNLQDLRQFRCPEIP
ncbi:type VI secretion system membrane subunit TssM [Chelatococcus asaccharovorans]|uniref:type VI secretion system membrane subunit TssM n=1 Tax=Chelatococcus asaccharovorans TaxID=28210 RepID=UPI00224C69D2|nr:type VI secretion system membrane subunit TssM [Chelatococcus asaccharovorans]CAH1661958.1 IcmF-related protein [Chelatococcus asaccharovorans]CAH1683313.1 IcmF-related protein [Chelatococcus asaccharovorans]